MKSREITNRYRLAEWAKIIQERSETGEKINEFLSRKGITKDTYYYWLRKLRVAAGGQLAEAQPKHQTALAVRGFTEIKIAEPEATSTTCSNQISIEIGSCKITTGVGYPIETLVVLLRELKQP